MSFSQIDAVVGSLPNSARRHPPFWANSLASHAHARAWLDAGFTASPDFVSGRVRFTRGAPRTAPAVSPTRRSDPVRVQAPIDPRPTGETHRAEIAYAWLAAGEVTLVDGHLAMPALGGSPGIYRFALCDASGEEKELLRG